MNNRKCSVTPSRQSLNNVTVTLEPISIDEGSVLHRVKAKETFNLLKPEDSTTYEVKYTPILKQKDRLQFRVKITNKSKRVLRPSDSVLTFNVDGESTSVSGDEYESFLNMMVAPGSSKEVIINGPKLSELSEAKGLLAIDIFELKIGDKLGNYGWFLSYNKEDGTINTVQRTDRGYMFNADVYKMHGKLVKLTDAIPAKAKFSELGY